MPDAIPADRVAGYGARPPKLVTYPGLKEEYYLADFEPDPAVPRFIKTIWRVGYKFDATGTASGLNGASEAS